jgi:hypothetical protein
MVPVGRASAGRTVGSMRPGSGKTVIQTCVPMPAVSEPGRWRMLACENPLTSRSHAIASHFVGRYRVGMLHASPSRVIIEPNQRV